MRATLLLVVTLWSILLLGWLTLHWGILPHINEWRGRIEQQASVALGVPVHIGHIEVQSSGWVPVLELLDVRLQDTQGRVALRLPRVSAALAPQSLLALELRFAQLHLRDVQLVVRRDAAGQLHVGGLDLPEQASAGGSASADWFLAQHEFVIENGQLQWIDEAAGTPPVLLQQVQVAMRNGVRRHDWRISATPPAELGQRFSLTGRFTQPLLARTGDWRRWSGTVYAEWPAAHLSALRQQLRWPVEPSDGSGALRAWVDVAQGQWHHAVLDSQWADLELGLPEALPPLRLSQAQGRLTAEQGRDGLQLAAHGLRFQTADGLAWPATQARFVWPGLPELQALQAPREGEVALAAFDLAALGQLVGQLPLPVTVQQRWADLGLQGQVQGLRAQWHGPLAQPTRYRVQGQIRDMALAPGQPAAPGDLARPGWRHVDLSLDASETGGQAQLGLHQGALWLPGLFAEPELPLTQAGGKLVWTLTRPAGAAPDAPPDIALRLQDGRFANADAQGEVQLQWHTGDGSAKPGRPATPRLPGSIDLSGRLHQARATAVARYLPLSIGATVRDYVAAAVQDGQIPHATFKLRGPLQDFPFDKRRTGEFRVAAQIRHGVLAYVPDTPAPTVGRAPQWPPFSEVQGELVFDRGAMEIHHAQARLWGVALQQVDGAIRDLAHQPTLSLKGEGRGPLNDALRYLGASPVGAWTRHALGQATGSGEAELKLQLDIPLDDLDHTRVDGSVTLAGNDVRLRPNLPLMAGTRARVHFSHQGFSIEGGTARLLGGEVSVEGGAMPDGSVRIRAQGTVSAEGLRQATELGPAARLAGLLNGQTPYQFQLGFARGQTEYSLQSPLTGLAIDLPAPLRKAPTDSWPLLVQAKLAEDGTPEAKRDSLKLSLGSLVQAEWQRELGGPRPRVLRGAIGLGQPVPGLPAQGVTAAATLGTLQVAPWVAAGRHAAALLAGPPPGTQTSAAPLATATPPANTPVLDYLPTDLAVQAQALALHGRALTQVQARVQRPPATALGRLHLQLQADQTQGEADWQPANGLVTPAKLVLRLARLDLPPATVPVAEAPTAAPPATVDSALPPEAHPTLDIAVDALSWRQRPLGRLALAASGTPREWRVDQLSLANADAVLSGGGHWAAKPTPRMDLSLQLQLNDSGALLERVGLGKVLRHGRGQIQAQLQWPGSPLEPRLATVVGQAQVALDSGQFLQVEPGVGRLLGMVNLQSLPRRMALDFRDLYEQGFGFDHIRGDLKLEGGVARTHNLRVRGVQAVVLMEGQSDLQRETQDLHLLVVPETDAGTASLAYAAINPAVGLGTFLAQYLLRDTLQQAGTREFRITGTWDHPVTEDGEAGAPRATSPTAAASAPGNNPR